MQPRFISCTILALCAPLQASAFADAVPPLPVTYIAVEAGDAASAIQETLGALADDGHRIVITGAPGDIARVRPSFANAWPFTNTVILDPVDGLGIFGFDAEDAEARQKAIDAWPWRNEPPAGAGRSRRAVGAREEARHASFQILADSPAAACRQFSRQVVAAAFGDTPPTRDERRALRREVRRWCQYGNLSAHAAEPSQFVIGSHAASSTPLLSLVTEWALVRSEDSVDPTRASYLFWAKSMGEGAGNGFTRREGTAAWYDSGSERVRDVMDVAIHSGWGPIEARETVTAWPRHSTFPGTGNVHVFRCDAPAPLRPAECPVSPMLRKLYPADSSGSGVSVSAGETINMAGEIKIARGLDSDGDASLALTLGLHALRSTSRTAQVDLPLARVHSSADTVYYRSTWWRPDVPAIFAWIAARHHAGSLAGVTPLASTLNPRHEIVWELPLESNAGRTFAYHTVYEAGLNDCANGPSCAAGKPRVGWSDGIELRFPSN
jgi:hypothetical protein